MTQFVRKAEVPDYVNVRPLLEIMGHVSDALLKNRFSEYVQSSDHCIMLAVRDGEPIGYAWAQNYGPHLRSGKSYARLHDLAVTDAQRHQGVGRALFEAIIEWCQTAEIVELQWQAATSAASFYERLGLTGDTKSDLEEYPYYEIAIGPSNKQLHPTGFAGG